MALRLLAALFALAIIGCTNTAGLPSATVAPNIAPTVEDFRSSYFDEVRGDGVVGLSVAVVSGESVLWADAYGRQDRAARVPASLDTSYLIGSVTKVFTALAVMQLVDRGIVELDRSYAAYVPEFSMRTNFGDIGDITVRHLLTHHAGIPDDVWAGKFRWSPDDYRTLLAAANELDACYPPGMIRVYSNLGYALLGYLVERVSGTPYQDYVRENIFAPLGMEDSRFYTHADQQSDLASAYDDRKRRAQELPLLDVPAGGISSTVMDMARLLQALLRDGSSVVSPNGLKEMFRAQNLDVALDLDDRVGLCFVISNHRTHLGPTYTHGGATLYHRARIYIAPGADLAAVVLSNSANGVDSAWRIHEELMVRLAQERETVTTAALAEKPVHFASRAGTDLAELTGTYASPGVAFQISLRHEELYTSIAGRRFYLMLDGRDAFVPAARIFGALRPWRKKWFLFHEIDRRMLLIEAKPWGDLIIIGERFVPTPVQAAWHEYEGRYRPVTREDELPMTGDLVLEIGDVAPVISFTILGQQEANLTLDTRSPYHGVTRGLGRLGGETVRVTQSPEGQEIRFKGMRYTKIQ